MQFSQNVAEQIACKKCKKGQMQLVGKEHVDGNGRMAHNGQILIAYYGCACGHLVKKKYAIGDPKRRREDAPHVGSQ
jgi:hypothetical protein